MTTEHKRIALIAQQEVPLPQWGPYLSERQWGTVREDYSHDGNAWQYFPFEEAHSRAYQWGEDGLAGICDDAQQLCFAIALWNGKDAVLKERLFGLSNSEGNHGEDVKELYYYTDNIPSHYYMEYLYKYPQLHFPYNELRTQNAARGKHEGEYEILDTGVFNNNRYFDVQVAYAKQSDKDIFIRIQMTNRYAEAAPLTLLPTLWFSQQHPQHPVPPYAIRYHSAQSVFVQHPLLEDYYLYFQQPDDLLFTNNITNTQKVTGVPNKSVFVKDAFHDAIVEGKNLRPLRAIKKGTKCSPVYHLHLAAGETKTVYLRLSNVETHQPFAPGFEQLFAARKEEANAFYNAILPMHQSKDWYNIQRQALAGLLWTKQYYNFDVAHWLNSSDGITEINSNKQHLRNGDWLHLKNKDIISMPDKWEYPWYAAWDLAFQCIAFAKIDVAFAKHQLLLVMREWYMKADGQLPAYEWNFSDVNPPVHAWAALQVYQMEKTQKGKGDLLFLKKIFQKLLINFTWWVNRKDRKGNNIFEGGFLGLDNIGVFNRSFPGTNMQLEQADATSWMGTYALNMMEIALEIAQYDAAFEDSAIRFLGHFRMIASSINEHHLWNEEDKFFYDVLSVYGSEPMPLQVKSIVGLMSLFAVAVIDKKKLDKLPNFKKQLPVLGGENRDAACWLSAEEGDSDKLLLSLVPPDRLTYLLQRMLDENEFLSDGGIRALSRYHQDHPYTVTIEGVEHSIAYDPGDSTSDMFGGNSNWRGPVWLPINYLFIQSIRRYGAFYGNDLLVAYPTRLGNRVNLDTVADELTKRVISLFEKDREGRRKTHGSYNWFYQQKGNEDLLLFYEYFHGDNGAGLGASHQTGWTALIAELISELKESEEKAAKCGAVEMVV